MYRICTLYKCLDYAIMARDAVIDTLWSRKVAKEPHPFWAVFAASRLRWPIDVILVGGLPIFPSDWKGSPGGQLPVSPRKLQNVNADKGKLRKQVMCARFHARVPNAISRLVS
jgi:hypothetical protein